MPRSSRLFAPLLSLLIALPTGLAFAPGSVHAAPGDRSPDGVWSEADPSSGGAASLTLPDGATPRVYDIDPGALTTLLSRVPAEEAASPTGGAVLLTLPLHDGSYARFELQASPVFSPEIAWLHPEILSFVGQGVDDRTLTATMVQTPAGFYAFIRTADGMIYMEPSRLGNTRQGISYMRDDLGEPPTFECGVKASDHVPLPGMESAPERGLGGLVAPSGATLHTYRLAVSATGEFTQFFDPGGGSANTLIQIAASVAAVNAIYLPEVAIRFQVSCNNVFTDPTTDPFTAADNSNTSIGQNQGSADANCGGSAGYDIGHVFHRRTGSGFSGLAGGNACNNGNKAMGYSSVSNPIPATMIWVVDQLCHEMGHQFTAGHIFNSDVTGCGGGNRSGSDAYEPGSGSTIMSYAAGTRCDFDFPGSNDAYFHGHSFDQITNHRDGGCVGTTSATGNTPPTVNAGADYTIPRGTPFTLTASGSDADGDPLTYCWEQFDLGSAGDFATNVNGPLFRSRPPTSSPARTMPILSDIVAGNPTPVEILPLVDRTLHFRCTVRDNRVVGGGVNNDEMVVTVQGDPFKVTAPNGGETLHADCATTVTWTVGGGSVAANVDILLSTDGGGTFPTTLAASVPNDGSQEVRLPCGTTSLARVMVRAVGNIFFDVSDADASITNDTPVATIDATGGDVGGTCEFLAPYTATITDDCEVDASSIDVTASSLDGLATVGTPTMIVNVVNAGEVQVSGTVLVSALTGCPANVRVTISGKDRCGLIASNFDDIQVVDTTPPTIAATLNRYSLWPPNHKLATIVATVAISDNCPGTSWVLESVTSDEPENGTGDGDTAPDIIGADIGTADTQLQLRSERKGNGDGRDYTLVFEVSDGCGNKAQAVQHVVVPHNQGANAMVSQVQPEDAAAARGVALIVLGGGSDSPEEMVRGGAGSSRAGAAPASPAALDPGRIDTRRVQIGNVAAVASPAAFQIVDTNDDGQADAVFWFGESDFESVMSGASPENGTVGLYFETLDGVHYLVPDITALEGSVVLPLETLASLRGATAPAAHAAPAAPDSPSPALAAGAYSVTQFLGAFPNPFSGSAMLRFQLASELEVAISIFDLRGAQVRALTAGRFGAGRHEVLWDGIDDAGRRLPKGVYLIRFAAGGFARTQKLVLMN